MTVHSFLRSIPSVLILLSAIGISISQAQTKKRLAVLDFKVTKIQGKSVVSSYEAEALTGALRAVIADLDLYVVINDENIYELLPPGTRLEDCVGKCEVETGRLLGAHYMLTGVIGKLGGNYDLLIRLYDTQSSGLLSSKNVGGKERG